MSEDFTPPMRRPEPDNVAGHIDESYIELSDRLDVGLTAPPEVNGQHFRPPHEKPTDYQWPEYISESSMNTKALRLVVAADGKTIDAGVRSELVERQGRELHPEPMEWATTWRDRLAQLAGNPGGFKQTMADAQRASSIHNEDTFRRRQEASAFLDFLGAGSPLSSHTDKPDWEMLAKALDNVGVLFYGGEQWQREKEQAGFSFDISALTHPAVPVSPEHARSDRITTKVLRAGETTSILSDKVAMVDRNDMTHRYGVDGELRGVVSHNNKSWGIMEIYKSDVGMGRHARKEHEVALVPFNDNGQPDLQRRTVLTGFLEGMEGVVSLDDIDLPEGYPRAEQALVMWKEGNLGFQKGYDSNGLLAVESAHVRYEPDVSQITPAPHDSVGRVAVNA